MSFLNNLFGGSAADNSGEFWNTIESETDLERAVADSFSKKVIIFKHSTRCGVSRMVLKNFENEVNTDNKGAAYYFLDLLKYRPLSNLIEQKFGVQHQSPQMIVLQNGQTLTSASHSGVSTKII